MLYTEMVTAPAVLHGPKARLLDYSADEHPVALQLGGSDPRELAEAVKISRDWGYDEINLNVGCPSDRVQSGQFGACLCTDFLDAAAILAKNDGALRFPGDQDLLMHFNRAILTVRIAFRNDCARIGQLLMDPQIELFPGDLRGQQTGGQVGGLFGIGREVEVGVEDLPFAQHGALGRLAPGQGRGARALQYRMVRRHHRHQGFGAHLLKTLAPVDAGPLEHQRQLRAAAVQQGQRIHLRCGQHLHLQQRVFVRQRGQRRRPARGQQFGRNRQGQALLQPLRQGQQVMPLLTTGSGFARYRMNDVLEVSSHWRTLPCFRFLGRNDGVDLVGEKISATLAQTVLDRLDYAGRLPITLLALDDSSGGRPGYVLLLESSAEQGLPALQSLAQQLENALLDNFHYRLARDLGQLAPARCIAQPQMRQLYLEQARARGMLEGNIKLEALRHWPGELPASLRHLLQVS